MRGAVARKLILFGVLGAVVLLMILDRAPGRPTRAAEYGAPAQQSQQRSTAGNDLAFEKLALPERATLGKAQGELFGSPPAPPPARVVAHDPAPEAPPLPYRFAGVTLVGGERHVYLSKGDKVFDLKGGEILDGDYKVDAIDREQVHLTYLPLKKREDILITSMLLVGPPAAGQPPTVASPREAGLSSAAAGKVEGARLSWDGPARVRVGTPFKVTLRVNTGQAVHATPMQLRFDPKLLVPVSIAPGSFYLGSTKRFVSRVDPDGAIFVGATKRSAASANNAELVVLTLRAVKSSPSAEIEIATVKLQDTSGKPIELAALPLYRTAITP